MENYIVGFGLNQKGDCGRNGLPESFDYFFNNEEKLEDFLEELNEVGYADRYNPPITVTVGNIVNILREADYSEEAILSTVEDYGVCLDEGDLAQIL